MEQRGGWGDFVTSEFAVCISNRETFFITTVNANGHPAFNTESGVKFNVANIARFSMDCATICPAVAGNIK